MFQTSIYPEMTKWRINREQYLTKWGSSTAKDAEILSGAEKETIGSRDKHVPTFPWMIEPFASEVSFAKLCDDE